MRVEKNMLASLLGFILEEKDMVVVRTNMRLAGVCPILHMRRQSTHNVYLKPHAPYALRQSKKAKFLKNMTSIKAPSKLLSFSLHLKLGDNKLQCLKSHDHHHKLQQILPSTIKSFLYPIVQNVVI